MDEPTQVPVTPEEAELSSEIKQWAMFTHLAAFAAFLIPFGNIIGPLLVWQLKKDLGPYMDKNGKFVVVGAVLLPVLGLYWLILTVVAGVKANNGLAYRYPLTIRFLK